MQRAERLGSRVIKVRFIVVLTGLAISSVMLVGSLIAQAPSPPAAIELQMMKQGELKAFVSATGWCKEIVHAIVRAPSTEPFKGDRINVQRMIGHLRVALSMECPQATAIMIDGFGADRHVYSGMASQGRGWILEETTPPAVASAAQECSALAAHPNDPERDTPTGVPDEDINADMAVDACFDALAEYPDDPVYRFQLARAYWKDQQYATAIEHFVMAAEDDHGGALAYLGDAVLYGLGGLEPDPEQAKVLYARAAEEGFEPAAVLAQEIEADPKAVDENAQGVQVADEDAKRAAGALLAQSSQDKAGSGKQPAATNDPPKSEVGHKVDSAKSTLPGSEKPDGDATKAGDYHFPKIVGALSSGNVQPEGVWPGRLLVYSFASVASVFDRCPELKPQGFDAREGFLRAMNTKLTYTEKLSLTESYEKGDMAELQEGASQDGARLAEMKGCAASETKTFVNTVTAHYAAG